MKKLDDLIYVFSAVCTIAATGTAVLIGYYACRESSSHLNVAIVAACVLTVMLGVILTILLLMKKQILPEEIHNENILREFVAKMAYDSKVEEKCKKICDGFKIDIDSTIALKVKELDNQLNDCKRIIEEKQAQKPMSE